MIRWQTVRIIASAIGAFMAPVAIVGVLSAGPFDTPLLPPIIVEEGKYELGVELLKTLCTTLITMSVGISVSAVLLYKQKIRKKMMHAWNFLFSLSMVLALISMFSGLRFLLDLSQQLIVMPIDLALIGSRIYYQGWSLLMQISTLSLSAVVLHQCRDGRSAYS